MFKFLKRKPSALIVHGGDVVIFPDGKVYRVDPMGRKLTILWIDNKPDTSVS